MIKKVIILCCLLFSLTFVGSSLAGTGYAVPNLGDYVFKYENHILYYAHKDDYTSYWTTYGNCWGAQEDCAKIGQDEHSYNWSEAIPGPLMEQLLGDQL
jgi:hypothetical protein